MPPLYVKPETVLKVDIRSAGIAEDCLLILLNPHSALRSCLRSARRNPNNKVLRA